MTSSDRWNPADFGHVDFQKEQDGQLTIFFQDDHEPPDPDDFASLEAYETAWTQWEKQSNYTANKNNFQGLYFSDKDIENWGFKTQQEDKNMFSFTAPIDNEIAQLQAKLAELEAQKQVLASRESCANKILEQVDECVAQMRESGVSGDDLFEWASMIFGRITGDFLPREKLNEAQDQIESLLKRIQELEEMETASNPFLADLLKQVSDLKIERDTALEKVGELDHQRDQAWQKYTDLTEASLRVSEELKGVRAKLELANQEAFNARKELADLTMKQLDSEQSAPSVAVTHITGQIVNVDLSEETETTPDQPDQEEDPRKDPAFLEASKNQETVSEFLRKLDRLSRVDKLDWVKIKELPLNPETMRELGLQINPKSKTHQYLMEKLPAMCAGYISETGDNSDLEWLPKHFIEKVQYLLDAEKLGAGIGNEGDEDAKKTTSLSELEVGDIAEIVNGVHKGKQLTITNVDSRFVSGTLPDGVNTMIERENLSERLSEDEVWKVLKKIKAAANPLSRGDIVIMRNPDSPYLNQKRVVLDSNGGWVNIKDSDGLTDMWNLSDVELVAN